MEIYYFLYIIVLFLSVIKYTELRRSDSWFTEAQSNQLNLNLPTTKLATAVYNGVTKNHSENTVFSFYSIDYLLAKLQLHDSTSPIPTKNKWDYKSNMTKRLEQINKNINSLSAHDFFHYYYLTNAIGRHFYTKLFMYEIAQSHLETDIENIILINDRENAENINKNTMPNVHNRINQYLSNDDCEIQRYIADFTGNYIGRFRKPFDATLTTSGAFYGKENAEEEVEYMFRRGKYNHGYIESLDASFVELPYADQNWKASFSLFIVVPHQYNDSIMKDIKKTNFTELPKNITTLALKVPKVQMEQAFDLRPFPELKIVFSTFYPTSSERNVFSAENKSGRLKQILHKARLRISEQGCDIYFSTELRFVPSNANLTSCDRPLSDQPSNEPSNHVGFNPTNESQDEFKVDREFFVVIVEKCSGEQILVAKVVHPSESDEI